MRRVCYLAFWGLGFVLFVVAGLLITNLPAAALELSLGQTVYVPVHSQVFFGDKARTFDLSATLTIRNIDVKGDIQITKVGYYNESGKHLRDLVDKPIVLKPWTSTRFFIKESDVSGGAAAFLIVIWQTDYAVSPPLVECVMIGAGGQQGVSFLTQGVVIDEKK